MRSRRAFLGAAGASTVLASARAADVGAQPKPYVFPLSQVLPLTSAINGIDYDLYVRLPPGYETSAARYPTVFLLDADYSFGASGPSWLQRWASARDVVLEQEPREPQWIAELFER